MRAGPPCPLYALSRAGLVERVLGWLVGQPGARGLPRGPRSRGPFRPPRFFLRALCELLSPVSLARPTAARHYGARAHRSGGPGWPAHVPRVMRGLARGAPLWPGAVPAASCRVGPRGSQVPGGERNTSRCRTRMIAPLSHGAIPDSLRASAMAPGVAVGGPPPWPSCRRARAEVMRAPPTAA